MTSQSRSGECAWCPYPMPSGPVCVPGGTHGLTCTLVGGGHLPCPSSTELRVGGPRTFPQALVYERSRTSGPLYCGELILEEDPRVEISRCPAPHGCQLPTDFTLGFLACH